MTEFVSLLISYVFMAIADSVDYAFGNNISIDAVVVIGCMTSISSITRSLSRIGSYYYRVERKNEVKCLQIDFIMGSLCGLTVFMLRDKIVGFYGITEMQRELLRSVLNCWAVYIPCYAIGNTSFEIVRLRNKLKLYRNGLIYFYVILIGTDALVYFTTRSLTAMYNFTSVCQIIVFAYFYNKMEFRWEPIDVSFVRSAFKYGAPIALERFITGFTIMLYGVMASRMDNISYAIHAVCCGASTTAESVTNAYNAALMIKLPLGKSYKETVKEVFYWIKKMTLIMLLIYVVYSFISLCIYHGKVSIANCFPWYIFYILEFIGLCIYENSKVLCVNQKYVNILPFGVLAGFTFRVILSIIGLHTIIPLVFFGIGQSFDWAFRGMLYALTLRYHSMKSDQGVLVNE